METPTTPFGSKLLPCNLDESCAVLDCEAVMHDYGDALLASPEGEEFVAHYCGHQFLSQEPESKSG